MRTPPLEVKRPVSSTSRTLPSITSNAGNSPSSLPPVIADSGTSSSGMFSASGPVQTAKRLANIVVAAIRLAMRRRCAALKFPSLRASRRLGFDFSQSFRQPRLKISATLRGRLPSFLNKPNNRFSVNGLIANGTAFAAYNSRMKTSGLILCTSAADTTSQRLSGANSKTPTAASPQILRSAVSNVAAGQTAVRQAILTDILEVGYRGSCSARRLAMLSMRSSASSRLSMWRTRREAPCVQAINSELSKTLL